MEYPLSLDLETFNRFLIVWACIGVMTAVTIHFTRLMPVRRAFTGERSASMSRLGMVWQW